MSYRLLSTSSTGDLEQDVEFSHLVANKDRSRYLTGIGFLLRFRILEMILLLVFCGLSFALGTQRTRSNTETKALELPFHSGANQWLMQWNISAANPSVFRGEPSATVDAAWDKIERFNVLRASVADLRQAGANVDAIPLSNVDSEGDHMTTLEIIYHMHCLNFLRKASFVDHEYYKDDPIFQDPLFPVEYRIRLCLDVLRHTLACHADESLMAYYWVEGYPRPYPNFNTWHRCRDYEAMLSWTDGLKVPLPKTWKEWRADNVTEFDAPLEAEEHPRPTGV